MQKKKKRWERCIHRENCTVSWIASDTSPVARSVIRIIPVAQKVLGIIQSCFEFQQCNTYKPNRRTKNLSPVKLAKKKKKKIKMWCDERWRIKCTIWSESKRERAEKGWCQNCWEDPNQHTHFCFLDPDGFSPWLGFLAETSNWPLLVTLPHCVGNGGVI